MFPRMHEAIQQRRPVGLGQRLQEREGCGPGYVPDPGRRQLGYDPMQGIDVEDALGAYTL